MPNEKFRKNTTQYLKLPKSIGSITLARLKCITFSGDIPAGYTVDHIDGNPLNNDVRNLRVVPRAINDRDGGFLRKLRNHGINVAMYPGIILEGYERMAKWKDSHKNWQYARLTRTELLQIFLGDDYRIDTRSSDEIMLAEMSRHQEI